MKNMLLQRESGGERTKSCCLPLRTVLGSESRVCKDISFSSCYTHTSCFILIWVRHLSSTKGHINGHHSRKERATEARLRGPFTDDRAAREVDDRAAREVVILSSAFCYLGQKRIQGERERLGKLWKQSTQWMGFSAWMWTFSGFDLM